MVSLWRSPPKPYKRLRSARKPLLIAGGGVHYSVAEATLAEFAARHDIPVVETVSGKSSLLGDDEHYVGPVGVTGCEAAMSRTPPSVRKFSWASNAAPLLMGNTCWFTHMPLEEVAAYLENLRRVLAPTGRVLASR